MVEGSDTRERRRKMEIEERAKDAEGYWTFCSLVS